MSLPPPAAKGASPQVIRVHLPAGSCGSCRGARRDRPRAAAVVMPGCSAGRRLCARSARYRNDSRHAAGDGWVRRLLSGKVVSTLPGSNAMPMPATTQPSMDDRSRARWCARASRPALHTNLPAACDGGSRSQRRGRCAERRLLPSETRLLAETMTGSSLKPCNFSKGVPRSVRRQRRRQARPRESPLPKFPDCRSEAPARHPDRVGETD